MAGHDLIEGYLSVLSRRLPAEAVEELADGLTETYQRHLSRGLDAGSAARAAVAEFGEPGMVLAAFVRQAPGRRLARALLGWGPVVGACWGASLGLGHAWTWPVPVPVRLAIGATLLAVIATLVVASTGHGSYRRTRWTAAAGLGVIGLDGVLLAGLWLLAPPFVWPMALAVPASAVRMTLTARAVRRLRER